MADDKPIIIIKKKGGHGGHHGGAWKVAYADFVTAMMAFFMVMWLVNSAETKTKQSIANYFRRPGIFETGSGTPLLIGNAGIMNDASPPMGSEKGAKKPSSGDSIKLAKKSGSDEVDENKVITYRGIAGAQQPFTEEGEHKGLDTDNPGDELMRVKNKEMLEHIVEELRSQIASNPELAELLGIVDIKVNADGLNMEIMDTDKHSMFASGSARVSKEAEEAFGKITEILKKMKNSNFEIVGHTDGKPYSAKNRGYSNWELSSDRANAARRLLETGGIDPENITSVIGRADKDPKLKEDPLAAPNRRITLKMKFDFNKKIDLSKDPAALDKLPEYKEEHKLKIERLKADKEAKKEEERIHSLTMKEINDKKERGIVVLPKSDGQKREEITDRKDKIFGDSPVLGIPELIYGE